MVRDCWQSWWERGRELRAGAMPVAVRQAYHLTESFSCKGTLQASGPTLSKDERTKSEWLCDLTEFTK